MNAPSSSLKCICILIGADCGIVVEIETGNERLWQKNTCEILCINLI